MFDQFQFPPTFPFLDCLLTCYCGFHGFMQFIPYQLMHVVTFGETGNQVILVFPDTLNEIGGNAHIQCTVSIAC